MEFRPCIDIHNGRVKQIVGKSLSDADNHANENFVAKLDAAYYARLYKSLGIRGGHVIMLNGAESEYYEKTKKEALAALSAWRGGLQAGGGITPENVEMFLDAGASHVIVTSYVFSGGQIHYDRLKELVKTAGKEHLVLDVSCKKKRDGYVIVTDRWQKETQITVTKALLSDLAQYCDEFLIHAVDVEGKVNGIEKELVSYLGEWEGIPVTYAGGVHNYEDLCLLRELGKDRLHVTIGSALQIFGGSMELDRVLEYCTDKKRTNR